MNNSKIEQENISAETEIKSGNEGGNAFVVRKKKKYQYQAFIWIAPAIVLLLVFCYYPPIYSIILSFTESRKPQIGEFVGFANYVKALTDKMFWIGMRNVLVCIVVGLIAGNLLTFIIAELLNDCKSTRTSNIYRFLFIVPMVVPGLVGMLIWKNIVFNPSSTGLVNAFLGLFGVEAQGWYAPVHYPDGVSMGRRTFALDLSCGIAEYQRRNGRGCETGRYHRAAESLLY